MRQDNLSPGSVKKSNTMLKKTPANTDTQFWCKSGIRRLNSSIIIFLLLLQISQLKGSPSVCLWSWKFSTEMKLRSLISLLTSLNYVLQSWETLEDSCANGS